MADIRLNFILLFCQLCGAMQPREVYELLSERIEGAKKHFQTQMNFVQDDIEEINDNLRRTAEVCSKCNVTHSELDHGLSTMNKARKSEQDTSETGCKQSMFLLRKAFSKEKRYVRYISESMSRDMCSINETLEHTTHTAHEISANFQTANQKIENQEDKLEELTSDVQRLSTTIGRLEDSVLSKLNELNATIAAIERSLVDDPSRSELKSYVDEKVREVTQHVEDKINDVIQRQEYCQSGEFGAYSYPSSPFPFEETIRFNPSFRVEPSFVYGTRLLDVGKDSNIRYSVTLVMKTRTSATVRIVTWNVTKLWGLKIMWMACPAA